MTEARPPPLHATLIACRVAGRWAGALLRGASGVGKSDLALRAMADGWRLVADDRVCVWRSGARLYGSAPQRLAGRIEARGLDVVQAGALAFAPIHLLVEAATSPERLPEPARETLEGVALARLELALLEPSAPLKLALALQGALREPL